MLHTASLTSQFMDSSGSNLLFYLGNPSYVVHAIRCARDSPTRID